MNSLIICGHNYYRGRSKPGRTDLTGQRFAQKEILLPTASGQRRILPSDLIYAETWERGVRLILKDGREETGLKISELAAMLPERQFVFCHRTILVNLAFIQSIRYCELELRSGATLPISKYRQSEA